MKLEVAFLAAVLLAGTSAVAVALLGATPGPPVSTDQKCVASDARIVVSLKGHLLLLCDKGKTIETFGVRLGRGGVGKTREGDGGLMLRRRGLRPDLVAAVVPCSVHLAPAAERHIVRQTGSA